MRIKFICSALFPPLSIRLSAIKKHPETAKTNKLSHGQDQLHHPPIQKRIPKSTETLHLQDEEEPHLSDYLEATGNRATRKIKCEIERLSHVTDIPERAFSFVRDEQEQRKNDLIRDKSWSCQNKLSNKLPKSFFIVQTFFFFPWAR